MRYLDWLDQVGSKCTFFVVGRTAEAYPDLVREIIHRGHEVGCHSHSHVPLTDLGERAFRSELERNIESLVKCGATEIAGFRAPTFSLIEATQWAYGVLKALKFRYSSSVLPARNPLFGWRGFQGERTIQGIQEIPVSVGFFPFRVPFGGGVYFRCLPRMILNRLFDDAAARLSPVIGYFHPYDIDVRQERFMHPHLGNSRLLNRLMYINRDEVFERLDRVLRSGFTIISYREYVSLKAGATAKGARGPFAAVATS